MPQPTVFRSVPKSDVQVTRFNAYKNWTVSNTDATASGYIPLNAILYDTRSDILTESDESEEVIKRVPGTPGTQYGQSSIRSKYFIKPVDRPTRGWFYYGLVPYGSAGGSVTNANGDITGHINGTWQIPGTGTVPGINYKRLTNQIVFYMPPSGSGTDQFQYWKFAVWDSLHHMFYSKPYDPANILQSNQADPNAMHKYLYHSASMISIPYKYLGEGVKPKSIEISSTRFPFTLTDDKYGNIRIPNSYIDTGSFAPNDNLVAYWGFNEISYQSRNGYYNGTGKFEDWQKSKNVKIDSGQFTPSFSSSALNIAFKPGIKTTGTVHETGYAANFGYNTDYPTDSFIKTTNFIGINPDSDFAWSSWIHAGTNQQTLSPTNTDRDIISKYGVERSFRWKYVGRTLRDYEMHLLAHHGFSGPYALAKQAFKNSKKSWPNDTKGNKAYEKFILGPANYYYTMASTNGANNAFGLHESHIERDRYPYRLGIYDQSHASAGHVYVRRSNGTALVDFSSSADLRNTDAHLVLQKTGSLIELWVNGTLDNSGSDVPGNCNNNSLLMFGASNSSGSNSYSGSLDEVRYYDTGLTSTQINSLANNHYLSGSAYQTNVVGNVFRSFGYVVTSSPYWIWNDMFDQSYDWTLKHKSSLEVTEYNVLVNVPQGHFNVSMNPSATQGTNSDLLLGEFTSSLRPYVSTIGLYGPEGHLLAIGKLSNAIQKRRDVDMNFVVRWDM
jgi:hypothetical protein